MQLAFYKAFPNGKLYQKAIAWWTKGKYCHVELVWNQSLQSILGPQIKTINDAPFPIMEHDPNGSLCFSSSEQDGGTRFKILDLKDGNWDIVELPPWLDPKAILLSAKSKLGVKYDWLGLVGFVFPWQKSDPNDLFCSEVCTDLLKEQGILKELVGSKTSPNALYKAISK